MIETVRSLAPAQATPEVTIEFSPHKGEYSYNVGEETVKPANTFWAKTNETITFTATVTFPNTLTQWAVGYRWDFGDGNIGYNNPATHKYLFPSQFIQVILTVTDNKGHKWHSRRSMYLE